MYTLLFNNVSTGYIMYIKVANKQLYSFYVSPEFKSSRYFIDLEDLDYIAYNIDLYSPNKTEWGGYKIASMKKVLKKNKVLIESIK